MRHNIMSLCVSRDAKDLSSEDNDQDNCNDETKYHPQEVTELGLRGDTLVNEPDSLILLLFGHGWE